MPRKTILIEYTFEDGQELTLEISMLHEIDADVDPDAYAESVINDLNLDHATRSENFDLISVNDNLTYDEIRVLKMYIYFYSA